jgi:hypothetical protein
MQRNHVITPDYVQAFISRTEDEAARNLRVLERIEATCGALRAMADFTRREVRSTYYKLSCHVESDTQGEYLVLRRVAAHKTIDRSP